MGEGSRALTRRRVLAACGSILGVAACGASPSGSSSAPTRAAASPPPSASPPAPPAPLFELHSGFWINLHLRLHHAATGRRPAPDAAPRSPSGAAWDDAVAYYRRRFGQRGGFGLIFDPELVQLGRLLGVHRHDLPLTGVDPDLARHLELAAEALGPGWSANDELNTAWMRALQPHLARHGAPMVKEIDRIYGATWPAEPIRVEVSPFAGPVGAYTVSDPPLTVISSADPGYAGDASLEMIFHEASHLFSDPLEKAIAQAAAKRGHEPPRDLWHAVLFFIGGEIAKKQLGPSYVPYADKTGMWSRWSAYEAPVRRECPRVLGGTASLQAAAEAMVAALPPEAPVAPG